MRRIVTNIFREKYEKKNLSRAMLVIFKGSLHYVKASACEYYLTAGKHEAGLPDFLSLKKLSTREIEYDLGENTYLSY